MKKKEDLSKSVKQEYKNWAKNYDEYATNISIIVEKDVLIKKMNPQRREVILDLGCGTGRYVKELSEKCRKIIGVDFSKEMLEVAKVKNPNVEFYQKDITKRLPFKNNTFDKIISSLVFSHLTDISKPLKECRRILKKSGKLFITDFPGGSTIDWKSIKYKKKIIHSLDVSKTCRFHSIAEYIDKTSLIGFKLVGIIPLRVTSRAKKYLTKKAYEKNKGKFGSMIYVFEKKK